MRDRPRQLGTLALRFDHLASLLILMGVIVLWWVSIAQIDMDKMGDLGLLTIFPWGYYIALVVLTANFCLVVHQRDWPGYLPLLHIVVLILIMHATPALRYEALRYSWAWKHLGIIEYIHRFGYIDPHINVLNVYHNWPGFFALGAFLSEAAGLPDAMPLAVWAPVFFNLIDLTALLVIFRSSTVDRRLTWLAAWFFVLGNWVGQDYFSPQAHNYFMHLVIVMICVAWLRYDQMPSYGAIVQWLRSRRLAKFVHQLLAWADAENPVLQKLSPAARTSLITILLLNFAVIVSSHQLTPFMTILTTTGLVVCLRLRTLLLPLVLVTMTILWLNTGAYVFTSAELMDALSSFGAVSDNLTHNLVDLSQASAAQRIVALIGRIDTLLVLGLAFLGGLRRLHKRHFDLTMIVLVIAPFLMLAGNGYGGEILFRVYFFALPGLAFFSAAFVYPAANSSRNAWAIVLNLFVSGLLLTGFMFAYFGKDQMYYFSQYEVRAAQFLANTAPYGSLLVEGSSTYPSRFRNYENFTYVTISKERLPTQEEIFRDPVGKLAGWLRNDRYTASYIILTRSMKREVRLLPYSVPDGSLDEIETALLDSPKFTVLYRNRDAIIFVLAKGKEHVR